VTLVIGNAVTLICLAHTLCSGLFDAPLARRGGSIASLLPAPYPEP
jgi:hypothetical protein